MDENRLVRSFGEGQVKSGKLPVKWVSVPSRHSDIDCSSWRCAISSSRTSRVT